jgi:hypothetical protein
MCTWKLKKTLTWTRDTKLKMAVYSIVSINIGYETTYYTGCMKKC